MHIFFETVGEGADQYYVPSVAGYACLVVILILILLIISLISGKKKFNAKQLAFSAAALALAVILSNIKIIHMPMGGSITLFSMLFVTLIGYWFGLKVGICAAIAYGFLQLALGPYIIHPLQLCIDYIFAFGSLGLAGLFKDKKNGLIPGYWVAITARLIFSALSGMIFFASAAEEYNMIVPLYSFLYNGGYIVGEGILTTVLLVIPPVRKAIDKVGKL